MKRLFIITVISLLTLLIINSLSPEATYARPGGGHSYSKDENSNSSSDYDDDYAYNSNGSYESHEYSTAENWFYGTLTVLMILSFITFKIYKKVQEKRNEVIILSEPTFVNYQKKIEKNDNILNHILIADPNFSKILFLDFVTSLYIKYYTWYGKKEFKNLSPYLIPSIIEKQESNKIKKEIIEIVIGNISFSTVKTKSIQVEIDANYTLLQNGKRTRYSVLERWWFSRNEGVVSAEPEKMRELSCPHCGAVVGFTDTGNCESCGVTIKNGEMQWYLCIAKVLHQNIFETKDLAYYAPEKGTQLSTVFQPEIEGKLNTFANNHNINRQEWQAKFELDVVTQYFKKLYEAWSIKKLETIRHLLTDRLYESYMFWISNYNAEGFTNKLDNVTISKIDFAKINIDKFYESAIVRVHASCNDYVINKEGKVVGGSAKKIRKFSEYWTFIRRTGVETDSYDYGTCPNCGAIADKMGQSGICEYCNTKISNGDFSWVLAVITQDEVYKG